jgi:hypothetical protein
MEAGRQRPRVALIEEENRDETQKVEDPGGKKTGKARAGGQETEGHGKNRAEEPAD